VIEDFDPDLAIVDIKMPKIDGPTFSKKILEKNPDIPILIITGFAAQYNIDEIMDIGVKKILSKPLDFNTLYESIQKYIS
jgi:DNA-binding NarL/FixJ family response regulator